jgi:hypothetical protein
MHDHATPLNSKSTDEVQHTSHASLAPKVPEFMKSSLMDYIVELIVSEDEVHGCDLMFRVIVT